jgi:hypothetical protein
MKFWNRPKRRRFGPKSHFAGDKLFSKPIQLNCGRLQPKPATVAETGRKYPAPRHKEDRNSRKNFTVFVVVADTENAHTVGKARSSKTWLR